MVNKSRYALFRDGFVPQRLVLGPEKPAHLKEGGEAVVQYGQRPEEWDCAVLWNTVRWPAVFATSVMV